MMSAGEEQGLDPRVAAGLHRDVPERVVGRILERRAELGRELAALVGGRTRIVLEIGCGHGHFLVAYGERHPETLCLGIDLIRDRIDRGLRKVRAARLENVHFLQAEAVETLDALPAGVELEAVFLLFPDPWPKKRHHKNRLLREDFLRRLAAHCAPGARLHFRTDHDGYFRDGTAVLGAHPDWQPLDAETVAAQWPLELPTVFQAKAPSHQSAIAQVAGRGASRGR